MKDKLRSEIFKSIKNLAKEHSDVHVKDLLSQTRLKSFQVNEDIISYDYSKQRITEEGLEELLLIPDKINLKDSINSISKGNFLNPTEKRNVSHLLYRSDGGSDKNKINEIVQQEKDLRSFISNLAERPVENIKDIISIGIGGSRLGPELLSEIFKDHSSKRKVHYCSSLDTQELDLLISSIDPSSVLLVISSKSFSTKEVMINAGKAVDWIKKIDPRNYLNRVIGISSNIKAMEDFGIIKSNQFKLLESLGGRFSVWSSISLPAIIDIGWKGFKEFKLGALEADHHFINSSWKKNIPVLMALMSCWNMNGLGINNLGIFTYDYKIRSLVKYLTQLGMESNGKTFNSKNQKSYFYTSPLTWGGYGPDLQHSVFQWILQGSYYSSCDFIGIKNKKEMQSDSYISLLAQIEALSIGEENKDLKFKSITGNNPISLLRMNEISPRSLGFLIASYEHKVFVESQIYGVDPFDQWGVKLGKKLSIMAKEREHLLKNFDKNILS